MFQYAAGLSLAVRHNVALKLDISALRPADSRGRTYALDCFGLDTQVPTEIASRSELAKVGQHDRSPCMRWLHKVRERCTPRPKRLTFREQVEFRVDPGFWKVRPPVYLSGYWQAVGYFKHVLDDVKAAFTFRDELTGKNGEIAERIAHAESVAVHVRRGDYAQNPITRRKHGLCSLDYYQRCTAALREQVSDPFFFIFSDDPEWVRSHGVLDAPSLLVAHNTGRHDHLDLHLMSRCKHQIIANSTFSWWGAWLNAYSHQKVYAPKQWLNEAGVDTSGLLPDAWERM